MKPHYSLRRTLYRDAPRADQVRMSGATAQKVRIAGLEATFVGGEWWYGWRRTGGTGGATHPSAAGKGPTPSKQQRGTHHQYPPAGFMRKITGYVQEGEGEGS